MAAARREKVKRVAAVPRVDQTLAILQLDIRD